VKTFVFLMQLLTPQGPLPPQTEPMPSLEACIARTTEMQTKFADIHEQFRFMSACIQVSEHTDPA
jgi:hypothetical protein